MPKIQSDGFLAGRFDSEWEPAVEWSCLTGSAQFGIILGKLYEHTGDVDYLVAMESIIEFLLRKQIANTGRSHLDGAMPGSYPLSGEYCEYQLLNWATKFFVDLLMLEAVVKGRTTKIVSEDII